MKVSGLEVREREICWKDGRKLVDIRETGVCGLYEGEYMGGRGKYVDYMRGKSEGNIWII